MAFLEGAHDLLEVPGAYRGLAAPGGTPRVAQLIGPPGAGKTMLARRLRLPPGSR